MKNPNHHLWNNHGTWFLHYTTYPTPITKERIRCSLRTRDLEVARARRDEVLQLNQAAGQQGRVLHAVDDFLVGRAERGEAAG